MTASPADRLIAAAGALSGLLGVALAAYAAHATGPGNVETASRFLLVHAPALVGVALLARTGLAVPTLARLAGLLLVVGLALFCGDLSLRELAGTPLFRMAAPTGGLLLMAGWALAGIGCLWPGAR